MSVSMLLVPSDTLSSSHMQHVIDSCIQAPVAHDIEMQVLGQTGVFVTVHDSNLGLLTSWRKQALSL